MGDNMRLTLFALFALLLAACAPTSFDTRVKTDSGDVLPVEAGRIVDAATATAARIGTQNAQATATDVSSRATATAARQGTLDALAARQTEVSLQMTAAAGVAIATDGAASRTQAFQASQAAATPTAQALKTQQAAAAAQDARRTAQAENVAEFWQTLRTILTLLFVVGGLSAITVAAFDAITRIRVARLAQQAVIARESFRLLAPSHWAEWEAGQGYQVYQLPGSQAIADGDNLTIIENTPTQPDREFKWRQAVRLFCHYGDMHGFGIAKLGASGAAVVSDPGWRVLSKMLKSAGVLADVPIPGQKGRATAWAPDWNYRRLFDDLGHARLSLPFPAEEDPPKVAFTVPNMTTELAQHDKTTLKGQS
jgi:hypothetical protein